MKTKATGVGHDWSKEGDRDCKKGNQIEAKSKIVRQFCCSSHRCQSEPSAMRLSELRSLHETDGPALLLATVGVFIASIR
jgi:hypothetical protein